MIPSPPSGGFFYDIIFCLLVERIVSMLNIQIFDTSSEDEKIVDMVTLDAFNIYRDILSGDLGLFAKQIGDESAEVWQICTFDSPGGIVDEKNNQLLQKIHVSKHDFPYQRLWIAQNMRLEARIT